MQPVRHGRDQSFQEITDRIGFEFSFGGDLVLDLRCIARRTWPKVHPSMPEKIMHHQRLGPNI